MCPACMAAAAATAAKVVSLGGLTAYGVKKLLFKARPQSERPPRCPILLTGSLEPEVKPTGSPSSG